MWYLVLAIVWIVISVLFSFSICWVLGRKTPKKAKNVSKLLIFALFFIYSGCSGPVTKFRNVAENQSYRATSRTVDMLLWEAEQVSYNKDTCVIKRFAPGEDLLPLKTELKKRDRRFKFEINNLDFCTEFILKWERR